MRAVEAAALLSSIRSTGSVLDRLPDALRPRTMAEAYAIQDVEGQGQGVFGWKVGPAKPGEKEPRCSILLGQAPLVSPAVIARSRVPRGLAELEIAFTLKRDLPAAVDRETVISAICEAHLAFEILNSRYRDGTAISAFEGVADHQATLEIVIAPGRTDWAGLTLDTLALQLSSGDADTLSAAGSMPLWPTLDLIVWLAAHASGRGFPLRQGTVIMTGARLGPLALDKVSRLFGSAMGFEPVELQIDDQQPPQ